MPPGRARAAALLALAVGATGACKGDGGTNADGRVNVTSTTTSLSSASTSAPKSGGASSVTSKVSAGGQGSPTTGASTNIGGPPTNLAAVPFRVPTPGTYQYHERVQPASGDPSERAVRYQVAAVKGKTGFIRWDEIDPSSGAVKQEGDHYEESHDREGLYLLASIVLGKDECRWSPRSVLLPRAVIEGGAAETKSTCTVLIEGKPTPLTLVTSLKFLRTHDYTVAGASRPSIDVSRMRVLSGDAFAITSRGVDTYAFDLGVRVRTEDHSTTESGGRSQESTRVLTLTGAP